MENFSALAEDEDHPHDAAEVHGLGSCRYN